MSVAATRIAKGLSGGVNENGLLSVLVPWWVPTLEETLTIGDDNFLGVPQKDRQFGVWDDDLTDSGFQVGIRYEGVSQGEPNEERMKPSWTLEGSESEERIETHPKLAELREKYGGYIDESANLVFPVELPEKLKKEFGFTPDTPAEDLRNPLFGQKTYPLFQAVYTLTYIKTRFDGRILENIGKVYKSPPGINLGGRLNFNQPPPDNMTLEGRDWIMKSPTIRGRGNVIEISEMYWLSPPGGWNKTLHELVVV